jgi:hypothetical protein
MLHNVINALFENQKDFTPQVCPQQYRKRPLAP